MNEEVGGSLLFLLVFRPGHLITSFFSGKDIHIFNKNLML